MFPFPLVHQLIGEDLSAGAGGYLGFAAAACGDFDVVLAGSEDSRHDNAGCKKQDQSDMSSD
jgi:hypothetical protein